MAKTCHSFSRRNAYQGRFSFDKHSGKKITKINFTIIENNNVLGVLIGFSSIGNVKSQYQLEKDNESTSSPIPPELLANSVTTIMVKGFFYQFEIPLCLFPWKKGGRVHAIRSFMGSSNSAGDKWIQGNDLNGIII